MIKTGNGFLSANGQRSFHFTKTCYEVLLRGNIIIVQFQLFLLNCFIPGIFTRSHDECVMLDVMASLGSIYMLKTTSSHIQVCIITYLLAFQMHIDAWMVAVVIIEHIAYCKFATMTIYTRAMRFKASFDSSLLS